VENLKSDVMSSSEIKDLVAQFVGVLVKIQENHHSFDFMLHFNIDADGGESDNVSTITANTFVDEGYFCLGVESLDSLMTHSLNVGLPVLFANADCVNNGVLKMSGYEGYNVN
jgi:hypothetical protein